MAISLPIPSLSKRRLRAIVFLDIRIHEGKPATISNVAIRGNDQLYEEVVRRELYTKPGMLFNREYVMRSMRQIAQMGHFDQEKIIPNIMPNETNGTVDIEWQLTLSLTTR